MAETGDILRDTPYDWGRADAAHAEQAPRHSCPARSALAGIERVTLLGVHALL